ncbi:LexA family transcriptional regulator [Aerococcaceae bacterium zg-ZUI334]|uniref:XRE family transcriptional regulator n=1 Tax=Aerococcaceae bacterium zg-252 TaxID=2796928 RepID=UPI001BA12634|nr:LexA family transcriptional regulator [Aerococcaceae bacterium zg-ZUI334]
MAKNSPQDKENRIYFSNKLNELLDIHNKKQIDLHRDLNIPKSTITGYVKGTSLPTSGNVQKIADYFGIKKSELDIRFQNDIFAPTSTLTLINDTASQLNEDRQVNVLEYAEEQLDEQNKIIHLDEIRELYADYQTQYEDVDLYGGASAGTGVELFDEVIETIKYPAPVPVHDIALKVLGDSMTPLFQDGEVIFIKKKQDINNGQIGVFIVNGQGYVKKLYKGTNEVKLISLNSHYKDIVLTEHDDIHIVGLVVM